MFMAWGPGEREDCAAGIAYGPWRRKRLGGGVGAQINEADGRVSGAAGYE